MMNSPVDSHPSMPFHSLEYLPNNSSLCYGSSTILTTEPIPLPSTEWNQILVAATLLKCEWIVELANYKLRVLQHHKPDCSSEAEDIFHA